jgi:DNA helicase IV
VAGGVDGLTIATFHDVCSLLAERAGTSPDRGRLGDSDYYEALPEALFQALVARPDLRFEAIVVDEMQDFTEEWGTLLTLALTDTDNGVLYVFGDPAQDVATQGKRWEPGFAARFQLFENFRNTRSIAEYAASFAPASKLRSLGAGGLPVETVTLSSASDITAELAGLLERLVGKEAVPIGSIAVLSAMGARSSMLHDGDKVGAFVLAHRPKGEGEVLFDTARRFKGMEAEVVIVLEVEQARDVVRYVACTRARSHLIVFRIAEARASAA